MGCSFLNVVNVCVMVSQQKLHDWMLAVMVLCFVVIDLVMLVIYSAVEGESGALGAQRVPDYETNNVEEGVRYH